MRRERGRRRKLRKNAFSGFDLSNVNEQIMDFTIDGSSNSLELPDFSKMQRMQVSLTPLRFLHVQKSSLYEALPSSIWTTELLSVVVARSGKLKNGLPHVTNGCVRHRCVLWQQCMEWSPEHVGGGAKRCSRPAALDCQLQSARPR